MFSLEGNKLTIQDDSLQIRETDRMVCNVPVVFFCCYGDLLTDQGHNSNIWPFQLILYFCSTCKGRAADKCSHFSKSVRSYEACTQTILVLLCP